MTPAFAPYQHLASILLPFATEGDDGAHDVAHLQRVWKNAFAIQSKDGGDAQVLFAAVLLHDCVQVEKNSPLRAQASRLAARRATQILRRLGWQKEKIESVAHAIEAHSYTAGIAPNTLEARILQDADRLDAIGTLGIARCFYVAGRMGSQLYAHADPHAQYRPLDDARYALDHFHAKLLKLSAHFQTPEGQRLAKQRHERLARFVDELSEEI